MRIVKWLLTATLIALLPACYAMREGRQQTINAPTTLSKQETHDRALRWLNIEGYTIRREDARQGYIEASKVRTSLSGTRNEDVLEISIDETQAGTQFRVTGHTYLAEGGGRREINISLEAVRDVERLTQALRPKPF